MRCRDKCQTLKAVLTQSLLRNRHGTKQPYSSHGTVSEQLWPYLCLHGVNNSLPCFGSKSTRNKGTLAMFLDSSGLDTTQERKGDGFNVMHRQERSRGLKRMLQHPGAHDLVALLLRFKTQMKAFGLFPLAALPLSGEFLDFTGASFAQPNAKP